MFRAQFSEIIFQLFITPRRDVFSSAFTHSPPSFYKIGVCPFDAVELNIVDCDISAILMISLEKKNIFDILIRVEVLSL